MKEHEKPGTGAGTKKPDVISPTAGQGGNPGRTDHNCGKRAVAFLATHGEAGDDFRGDYGTETD